VDRLKMVNAALAYASKSVAVFPVWDVEDGRCGCRDPECKSPGKHPITSCAPAGFENATADEATIRRWWQQFPHANVATPTGGWCVVLDVDPRHGGDDALAELERVHGPLPETAEVVTGGGGRHVYFERPAVPIRNSAGKVGPGLDIRGEGGYVLLPPSRHISGGIYLDEIVHPLFDTRPAPMPQWLVTLASATPTNNGPMPRTADEWRAKLAGAPEGQRRSVALEIAGHYLGLRLAREEVEQILLNYARQCAPPFPEREARELVRDLARRDRRKHRIIAPPQAAEPSVTAAPPAERPYSFTPVVPAGHFLADYIAYGASRTDAAYELHEAAGLVLLAAATPNVRAMLAPYPGGLGTNLYVLCIGDSTHSRKSTVQAIANDLHDAVIPNGRLAELASPEALIEELAARPADACTWYVDEMADLLDKLHHAKHLAGLRGLLLTVYAGRDYRYARHSKRDRHGDKIEDQDEIRAPHVSVLGATTPAVFDILTSADIRSGLLPRFAIVMPQSKPPRMPFYGPKGWDENRRAPLAGALHRLYSWAKSGPRGVRFAPSALERLDAFAADLEHEAAGLDESARPMLHRLAPMALKVAMLLAAGHSTTPEREDLGVSIAEAEAAVTIATRWRADAGTFASRIGETEFERIVARCLRLFHAKASRTTAHATPHVSRRVIAQQVHVAKRVLDDVEGTLQDRGEIHVSRIEAPGRPTLTLWEIPGA